MNYDKSLPYTYLQSLPDLIHAIGQGPIAATALNTVTTFMHADHLTIFTFDDQLRPNLLDGSALVGENISLLIAQSYQKDFFPFDPQTKLITSQIKEQKHSILHLHASDIQNAAYRRIVYENHNLRERLSWLGMNYQRWYSINIYREIKSPSFSESEINLFEHHCGIIAAAIEQHIELRNRLSDIPLRKPSAEWFESILRTIASTLSQREIEVCARALMGMTRTGISSELGVKPTTINTLTQRAYAKLSISSLSELFALCLTHVQR